jgi:glycosyltransferase involved in cell wall biosynthesis
MNATPDSSLDLCLVMRQFYPVMAGAAERCRRYSPGLMARGVHMTAIARQMEPWLALNEELGEGLRVLRVPAESDVQAWDQALLRHALKHIRDSGHIKNTVLQTNLAFQHTRRLLSEVRQNGVPAVWLGSMMEDLSAGRSWWQVWRDRMHLHATLRGFDVCAVGSTAMRDWLRAAWLPARRIEVIGHGVDQTRFGPLKSAEERAVLRKRWELPQDGVITLLVGTVTARKGVHLLLEAWENHLAADPRAHLVLAGGFDRPTVVHEAHQRELVTYQQGVRAQIARLAATGRVRHFGEVADIHLLMRVCDILVLPSDREGVPNVVLEAMSCGVPCVLTPFIGLPREELGQEGKTWLLTERTSSALASTLSALINDEVRRQSIGAAAYQQARDHFGLEKTLDAYAALYRRLLREFHG